MAAKYPEIVVTLAGEDGNAFSIIGKVSRALRKVCTPEEVEAFQRESMTSDYNHVIQTAMQYVTVE